MTYWIRHAILAGVLVLWFLFLLIVLRPRTPRRRSKGHITTFPAFDAFQRWIHGRGSLQEFRDAKGMVVTELFEDEPNHVVASTHKWGVFLWGQPMETVVLGRRVIRGYDKWYGITLWRFNFIYIKPVRKYDG